MPKTRSGHTKSRSRGSRWLENLIKLAHSRKLRRYRQEMSGVGVRRGGGVQGRPKGRDRGRKREKDRKVERREEWAGSCRWYSNTFRVAVAVSTVKLAFTVPHRPLNVADYSAAAAVSNKTRSP